MIQVGTCHIKSQIFTSPATKHISTKSNIILLALLPEKKKVQYESNCLNTTALFVVLANVTIHNVAADEEHLPVQTKPKKKNLSICSATQ